MLITYRHGPHRKHRSSVAVYGPLPSNIHCLIVSPSLPSNKPKYHYIEKSSTQVNIISQEYFQIVQPHTTVHPILLYITKYITRTRKLEGTVIRRHVNSIPSVTTIYIIESKIYIHVVPPLKRNNTAH
jgi:hypothetical protein